MGKATGPKWNNLTVTPNYVTFRSFSGDAALQLRRPEEPRRRIEFVGDSITAGYCNLCRDDPSADPWVIDFQSFAASWANLICDDLGADATTRRGAATAWLRTAAVAVRL